MVPKEAAAPTPESVARLVGRILETENSRLHYSAGMLGQRTVVPLKRFVPQRPLSQYLIRTLGR